jgi:hypothetical protein
VVVRAGAGNKKTFHDRCVFGENVFMAGARSNQNRLTTAATSTPRGLDTAIRQKDRQERFLATFVLSGSIFHACRAARIHRQTHYYWLRVDPTYAAKFEEARQVAAQTLADEAVRRAVEGNRRPVTHNGKQVWVNINGVREPLWEHQYSDKLLVMLLRAANPSKYAPARETINLLDLDPDLLTAAQLDKLLDHLIVKMVGNDPEAIEAAKRDLAAGPNRYRYACSSAQRRCGPASRAVRLDRAQATVCR